MNFGASQFMLWRSLTQKPLYGQTQRGVDGTIQRHAAERVVDNEDVVRQCWVVDVHLVCADGVHQEGAAWEN